MRYRGNGGLLGPINSSNTASASGFWSMPEFRERLLSSTWPTDLTANYFGDPQFSYTTLLLKSIGANTQQNYTFLDSSTNAFTITRNGDTTQGAFSPFGIDEGKWSVYFDGTGDYLTVPSNAAFAFGTGDFTMEAWVYQTQRNTLSDICSMHNYGVGADMLWSINSSGNLYFQISSSSSGAQTTSTTVPLNTWTHVAIIRVNGLVKQYINGVEGSSGSYSSSVSSTINFSIGSPANGNSAGTFYGYISNVRVVKGTAVYTTAFTPSTVPLTAISGTSYLTCQSNRFKDNSTNGFNITQNGDVKISALTPFNQASAYATAINGGSAYFDGTDDYLSVPYNSGLTFGSGDFTAELWIYPQRTSGNMMIGGIWDGVNPPPQSWLQFLDASGYYTFLIENGADTTIFASTNPIQNNTWTHIAVSRSGNTWRLFINGVLDKTVTNSSTIAAGSNPHLIGMYTNRVGGDGFMKGYISDYRLVKGTAVYTSTFTPPTAPLTAITGTTLLVNATNAGIVDASRKTMLYTVGNTKVDTAVYKFSKSIAFDGTGDYLTMVGLDILGSGDFTVEFWMYPNSSYSGTYAGIMDSRTSGNGAGLVYLGYSSTANQIGWYENVSYILTGTVNLSSWNHVAFSRSGSTFKMFINGVQTSSTTNSTNFTVPFSRIGSSYDNFAFNGYIEDLRITRGVARYTANFTPPTSSFNSL